MSERVDRADPALAAIKKLAPVSLRVFLRDGTDRAVAMPKSGNRWARLQQTLESLAWERIECLDKDGKLAGAPIECEDDTDLAVFDDDPTEGSTVREVSKLMLEVMRTTMKETRQIFEAQAKAQNELVSMMAEGVRAVQDSYALAMRTQAAALAAGTPDGGSTEMMEMFKMAMMMQARGISPPQQPPPPRPVGPGK